MVALQAKDAWSLAPGRCAPTGCAWYHGAWPTLRLLGLVATPHRHRAFFLRELRGDRVLVSGAADAAMVELAHEARPGAAITVLDRCATPVQVAAEWAVRAGTTVDGWVVDLLEAEPRGEFDAICTHGLFSLVPDADRPRLAERWAALLRPGGVLVTTSSLAGPGAPDPTTFAPEAVDRFAERAREAAAAAADLPATVDEVVAAARRWAEGAHVHPVRSAEAVRDVLEGAGFAVEIGERDVEGPLGRDDGGPTSARSARYLEIVATRR